MHDHSMVCDSVHKRPSIKKSAKPGFEWRVRWKDGDKYRDRLFGFGKTAEAKAFYQLKVIEVSNHGTRHGTISDDERAALIHFRGAVAAMPEPRPSLRDCVNSYLSSIANQLKPITVHELVAKRAAAAEAKGVHSRTLRDLVGTDGKGGRLGAFAADFGNRQASGISADEIELWTMKQCATDANRREMLVRLRGLFAYGAKRRFLVENPVDRLELPRSNPARARILRAC